MMNRAFRLLISSFATIVPTLYCAAVAADAHAAAEPVDVVFVLDNSGSMRNSDPDYLTRTAVANFASALADDPEIDGRIAVVLFDGKAQLVRGLTEINAGETDALLLDALAELDFSGQRTNSPAGIERALYEFRQNGRENARRAIVFLTDGEIDTGDAQSDLDAARWLREDLASESEASGIRIFGVAFTDAADYQLMQALAQRTRARYYRAFEASELSGVVDDVLARIGEDDFYELALIDATPEARAPADNGTIPGVAAAPQTDDGRSSLRLLGLLPAAALLVAGALLWRRRIAMAGIDSMAPPSTRHSDAPEAQLLDMGGELGEVGSVIKLTPGRTRLGRDSHNELVLEDDAISSEHAVIELRDGRYWLEDLRSTNGTRVGDESLTPDQPVQLKGGDHIRLAEIDLMFVLAGYVPGGATVFLKSTTTTPSDWKADAESAAEDDDPEHQPPVEDNTDEMDGISANAVQNPLPETLVPDPEDLGSSDTNESDAAATQIESLRNSLDYHLERVAEISPAFASFIERAFGEEIRDAASVYALDLTSEAHDTSRIVQKSYTFDRVRFVICGVPGEMETARDYYVETFGGFTRLLSEQLHADSFRIDRCEILAVLTFGLTDSAWVSLSIVPDDDQDPRIDLLSYEFLTEEELEEIEPSERTGLSQSGLG